MDLKCPNCGSENLPQARFCTRCGTELRISDESITSPVYCPYCGSANPDHASFCQNCAKALDHPRTPQTRDKDMSRSMPMIECAWCGDPVSTRMSICPRCGHDPRGRTDIQVEPRERNKSRIAGVLMLGGGALDIVTAVRMLTFDASSLGIGIDVSGFLAFCGSLALIFGALAVIGGVMSWRGNLYTFVLVSAALGIIGVGPFYLGSILCLAGLIVAVLGRDGYSESRGW